MKDYAASPRVYFAQMGDSGLIKIGTARNIPVRLRQLKANVQSPLRLLASTVGAGPLEREWHARYPHLRIFAEWFLPGDDLLAAIAELPADTDYGTIPPKVNVAISEATDAALIAHAAALNVTLAVIVRWAIDAYFARPAPGFIQVYA